MKMNWLPLAAGAQAGLVSGACPPWLAQSATIASRPSNTSTDWTRDTEDDGRPNGGDDASLASNASLNADAVVQAELRMDSGSRAWRRQENRASCRAEGAARAAEFKQTLAEAAQSDANAAKTSPTRASRMPSTAPSTTEPETGRAASTEARDDAPRESSSSRPSVTYSAKGATLAPEAPQSGTETVAKNAAAPQAMTRSDALASLAQVRATTPVTSYTTIVSSTAAGATGSVRAASGVAKAPGEVTAVSGARAATRTTTRAAPETKAVADAAPRKDETNTERIVRFVRMQIGKESARATMRLDPPSLGKIRVDVQQQQDVVSLRIDTQNDVAHRLLMNDLDELRQSLEAAGIRVERLEIRPPEASAEARDEFGLSREADPGQDGQDGSAQSSAEHSHEGRESHLTASSPDAEAADVDDRVLHVTATESLVNCLA